jgi:hypothetical protein
MSYDFESVACPFCQAQPGELCVKRTGHAGEPLLPYEGKPQHHMARVKQYHRERDQPPPPDDLPGAVRWVSLKELLHAGRIEEVFRLGALALPDLGIAYGIRLVHGEAAAERYLTATGRVRFDPSGEPLVPVKDQ